MNLAGAISGMVVGAVTCFVWKFQLVDYAAEYPIFNLYELVPGFILAFLVAVVVSLLTPPPSDEITREFDSLSSEEKKGPLNKGGVYGRFR